MRLTARRLEKQKAAWYYDFITLGTTECDAAQTREQLFEIEGYREGDLAKVSILVNAEPVDALSMITYMGGGPALAYSSKALEAFDEFSA